MAVGRAGVNNGLTLRECTKANGLRLTSFDVLHVQLADNLSPALGGRRHVDVARLQ
jgi:hypothetical protein